MHYAIIGADDIADLERRIQEKCDQGWEPQGGLVAATWEYIDYDGRTRQWWFLQAIIRREG